MSGLRVSGFIDQVTTVNLNNFLLLVTTLGAIAVVWKILRFIFRIDRAIPTLLAIAQQFENNGGSTIKDKIDDLHANQKIIRDDLAKEKKELKEADKLALKVAEDSRIIANTNAAIVKELSDSSIAEMLHIKEYMHENMHDIRNSMTANSYFAAGLDKRMERLESQLDIILPLVSRRRESDTHDSGPTDE